MRSAGGTNETVFKFHRSVKIDGGQTVTVWSSEAPGVTHEPPTNIVMKQQKWFVGDNMRTVLLNADAEEVAASERVRHQVSSHASRHRQAFGGVDGSGELLQRQERAGSSGSSVGVSIHATQQYICIILMYFLLFFAAPFLVLVNVTRIIGVCKGEGLTLNKTIILFVTGCGNHCLLSRINVFTALQNRI